jgi:diaminohydroxyphosphoribosylaminopyrimidine deaminase/5-amino-6-(5-phosphoribosylamino)uracil reductase
MNFNESMMSIAINLAKNGLGKVSPKPIVGCVIVKDGEIIGEG